MNHLAEKISGSELEVMKVLWEAEDALPLTDIRLPETNNCFIVLSSGLMFISLSPSTLYIIAIMKKA